MPLRHFKNRQIPQRLRRQARVRRLVASFGGQQDPLALECVQEAERLASRLELSASEALRFDGLIADLEEHLRRGLATGRQ